MSACQAGKVWSVNTGLVVHVEQSPFAYRCRQVLVFCTANAPPPLRGDEYTLFDAAKVAMKSDQSLSAAHGTYFQKFSSGMPRVIRWVGADTVKELLVICQLALRGSLAVSAKPRPVSKSYEFATGSWVCSVRPAITSGMSLPTKTFPSSFTLFENVAKIPYPSMPG